MCLIEALVKCSAAISHHFLDTLLFWLCSFTILAGLLFGVIHCSGSVPLLTLLLAPLVKLFMGTARLELTLQEPPPWFDSLF